MGLASRFVRPLSILAVAFFALPGCSLFASTPAPATAGPKITATTDAEWAEATSLLRPSAADQSLTLLAKTPADPSAVALAAQAYAGSDAPGMTILYALLYRALGTDCASDEGVAFELNRVITQRITVAAEEGGEVSQGIRLAPEPAPLKVLPDGKKMLPLANAFVASLGPALAEYKGHFSIAEFHKIIAIWADSEQEIGSAAPLRLWVRDVKKAGHLEAFSYLVLGLAFTDEWSAYQTAEAMKLAEARKYLDAHLFVSQAPLRADDLVPAP